MLKCNQYVIGYTPFLPVLFKRVILSQEVWRMYFLVLEAYCNASTEHGPTVINSNIYNFIINASKNILFLVYLHKNASDQG